VQRHKSGAASVRTGTCPPRSIVLARRPAFRENGHPSIRRVSGRRTGFEEVAR
jgi:hypothetical protein